jgi:hypothetical protein
VTQVGLIHEKNEGQKSHETVPFKIIIYIMLKKKGVRYQFFMQYQKMAFILYFPFNKASKCTSFKTEFIKSICLTQNILNNYLGGFPL